MTVIKKPNILSDEDIQTLIGGSLEIFMGIEHNLPKILRAQNEYCYKEMLREFLRQMRQRLFPTNIASISDKLDRFYKDLQSQLGEE